jgi:hypothetical protein
MLRALSVGCLMLTFASTPAAAQMPQAPTCAAQVTPTGGYASWSQAAPMPAGRDANAPAALTLGAASQVALAPTPDVHYALRPEKPGGSVSYGGLLALDVASAGTYRIALGSAAWLDVIGKNGPLRSTAHGHGPDCTSIRKMVDFALTPGRYIVQISANGAPSLTVLALAVK